MNEFSKKAFTIDLTNEEVNFLPDLTFPIFTSRRLYVYDDMITIFHDEEFTDIPIIATYYYSQNLNMTNNIY
jgi:hypothetical protein